MSSSSSTMQLADSESSAGGGGGGRSLSSSPAPPSPLSIRVETSLVDVDLAVLKSLDGESVLHHLCQHRLNFRPVVIPLLGLRTPNGNWLAPHQVPCGLSDGKGHLECRLRFKTPSPGKLRELDRNAFEFYFRQVRRDFCGGQVMTPGSTFVPPGTNWKHKWYIPIPPKEDHEEMSRRFVVISVVTELVSYLMAADVLEKNRPIKEVVKGISTYLPNDLLNSPAEKLFGTSKLKDATEKCAQSILDKRITVTDCKRIFLEQMEASFSYYFEDRFTAYTSQNGKTDSGNRVLLTIKPPYHFPGEEEKDKEREACLEQRLEGTLSNNKTRGSGENSPSASSTLLCTVEDLCHITVRHESSPTEIEISRKTGIPLYFKFRSGLECLSFLSHLTGYYRLCEKWSFSLCNDVVYPRLKYNAANNVHGPLKMEFVEDKFLHKSKSHRPGTYLLCQSCDKFDLLHLYYLKSTAATSPTASQMGGGTPVQQHPTPVASKKPELVHIFTQNNQFKINLPMGGAPIIRPTLKELVSYLKSPESPVPIKDCLHPSEYDKASTLLICRSESKLKSEAFSVNVGSSGSGSDKYVIPFTQLGKFEDMQFHGKFTSVSKGIWSRHRDGKKLREKQVVAIKQLNPEFATSMMADFVYLSYNATSREDGTLVKVFGTTLATPANPMALITEFYERGPLNLYLKANESSMRDVDLVEACMSLSRALWYLEENNVPHGNIRASNVFVADHHEAAFVVRLGDTGMRKSYDSSDVHWLPTELLRNDKKPPLVAHCSSKGDVWAIATTFWEIFSFGATPLADIPGTEVAERYLRGERLAKPDRIKGKLSGIYTVMESCWNPIPDHRPEPQAIMKDINQILFRVFNSRKYHDYLTIDDDDDDVALTPLQPPSLPAGRSNGHLPGGSGNSQNTGSTMVDCSSGSSTRTMIDDQDDQIPIPLNNGSGPSINYHNDVGRLPLPPSSLEILPPGGAHSLHSSSGAGSLGGLVPMYNELMSKIRLQQPWLDLNGLSINSRDPSLELPPGFSVSRPDSRLSGSGQISQSTSLTSADFFPSSPYSMNSIYQLRDDFQLELNKECPLGEGNFGVVYRGTLTKSNGDWDMVAVKTLKDSSDNISLEALEEMERELNIMKNLKHDNVVKIKAICLDRNDQNRAMIIMEFIKEGSLDRYLHTQRDFIRFPGQLFLYARDIVEGMDYLQSQGIIHRDLAARNILVVNEEHVKISDFGLARSVSNDSYVMNSNTNIPVKWLALECLTHKKYSFASDVWSFGVILWEMFSFGASPYLQGCDGYFRDGATDEQHHHDMNSWVQMLVNGTRLPKPDKCPATLFATIMLPCWNADPGRRPSFKDLRALVDKVELQVT